MSSSELAAPTPDIHHNPAAARRKLIEDLKLKHGDGLFYLETGDGTEVFARCASPVEWKRFLAQSSDEKRRANAMEVLAQVCIVHPAPDSDAFHDLVHARPGLLLTWGGKIAEQSGLEREVSVGKL